MLRTKPEIINEINQTETLCGKLTLQIKENKVSKVSVIGLVEEYQKYQVRLQSLKKELLTARATPFLGKKLILENNNIQKEYEFTEITEPFGITGKLVADDKDKTGVIQPLTEIVKYFEKYTKK